MEKMEEKKVLNWWLIASAEERKEEKRIKMKEGNWGKECEMKVGG